MDQQESNTCLQCGKPILAGRADKKFCNAFCKDEYHNSRKVAMHREIQRIDLALKKNRNILQKFHQADSERLVAREQLLKSGFDFEYHTHFVTTKLKQNEFIFCYDFGYREVKAGQYHIIKSF